MGGLRVSHATLSDARVEKRFGSQHSRYLHACTISATFLKLEDQNTASAILIRDSPNKQTTTAMTSWLDSLPTSVDPDDKDPEPAVPLPDPEIQDATDPPSWLEAAGFDPAEVTKALAEVDNEDEAFALLRKGHLEKQEATPLGCKRGFEVDGYSCTADVDPKRIRLLLPELDMTGPVIGKVQQDGSMTVEIDEWVQELYFASVPRAINSVGSTFKAQEVDSYLSQQRPWIWEDFATTEEVLQAHKELEALREQGVLSSANSDTTGKQKARSDKVGFLEVGSDDPPNCLKLLRRMEAAVGQLSWSDRGRLLCPKFGMAAVYDGNGSFYAAHRDNEHHVHKGDGRPWVNFRSLTAVMYMNPYGFDDNKDGGSLRCFLDAKPDDLTGASATQIQEISPRGGRAVLFPSRTLLHEVLPSYRRRYALTLWFVSPQAGDE
eukprot:symbB.v1.2.006970.t1/scaffold348.1/size222345/9